VRPFVPSDPDQVVHNVGRRVAELRAERGLTQEQLAEAAGVSIKYLQRIEAGRQNLTIRSLVGFANLLDAKPVEFFEAPATTGGRIGRPPRAHD